MNFINNQARVEYTAGKRTFCLKPEEGIREYEKRMLCESDCTYTLPMHFTMEEGLETASYDFTGLERLEEHMKRSRFLEIRERENGKPLCSALTLFASILECMKGMERYLLFQERYSIHPDAIFVNMDSGQVSVAFYPNDEPELTLQERILLLADRMSNFCCDDEAAKYLNQLKDSIISKNPGVDGMIRILGAMQREAGYIYWNAAALRKEVKTEHGEPKETVTKTIPPWKTADFLKPAAVQAAFAAVLIAAVLSGRLDTVNFIGLAILAAGLDLWIMSKLRHGAIRVTK